MACHLKDCILDFGPFSSFWCFAFERYNGTLEGIKNSWINPETQMFRKFLELQSIFNIESKENTSNDSFLSLVIKHHQQLKKMSGYSTPFDQSKAHDTAIFTQVKISDALSLSLMPQNKLFTTSCHLSRKNVLMMFNFMN